MKDQIDNCSHTKAESRNKTQGRTLKNRAGANLVSFQSHPMVRRIGRAQCHASAVLRTAGMLVVVTDAPAGAQF